MTKAFSRALSPFRRGEVPVAVFCVVAVILTMLDSSRFEWNRGGEVWRIVTCHFTHWTPEQFTWDALAFAGLGFACARRDPRAFHATLLASIVIIPLALFVAAPSLGAYRGLSGIDSALFALLLVQTRHSRLATACAIGFLAKITFEAATGGAVFATNLGTDVIAVPAAHVAGALIGGLVGAVSEAVSSRSPTRPLQPESPA